MIHFLKEFLNNFSVWYNGIDINLRVIIEVLLFSIIIFGSIIIQFKLFSLSDRRGNE